MVVVEHPLAEETEEGERCRTVKLWDRTVAGRKVEAVGWTVQLGALLGAVKKLMDIWYMLYTCAHKCNLGR